MYLPKINSGGAASLALLLAAAFAPTVAAQDAAPPPAAPPPAAPSTATVSPSSILSVPLPPYARLRLDLDTRDDDILGVVKSYFRGFNGHSLKALLKSVGVADVVPGTPPAAGGAPSSQNPVDLDLDKAAVLQLMSNSDLETLLRDVHHLRVVVFETRKPPTAARKKGTAPQAAPPKPQSVVAYYEQAYLTREGGRRIMRGDFDDVQVLTVGFPQRGFAMVVQSPSTSVVVRADGYPNFEGAGPLMMAMMLRFTPRGMPYSVLQRP
ncbi:MAG TPA: hypothetical protein VNA16_06975 [Abditibacteriaceae bacterium]|nr:hypothetical protein [Abditibacteriaceae bacterium]